MRTSFGQSITWNGQHGPKTVSVNGFASPDEALMAAVTKAWAAGWRPRRLWDFPRMGEHELPRGWRRHLPRGEGPLLLA